MGDVVVTEFISMDGVIEDPGGAEGYEHGGWSFKFDRGPEGNEFKADELAKADAQLLGRVTYEGFAAAWPKMRGDDFGDKMNSMPKYVVSTTLEQADWENTTILRGDLESEIPELKQRYDGDILIAGSASLAQSLNALGLVDEYRLMVFPVTLGGGKRLFADDGEMRVMTLVESKAAGDALILRYRRA